MNGQVTPPTGKTFGEKLYQAFVKAIEQQAEEAKEQAIKKAVQDFERDLRGRIGTTAFEASRWYSLQSHGDELVIHIKQQEIR
jgi:hypothetical protein